MIKSILINKISEQHRTEIMALADQFKVTALTDVQHSLINIAYFNPDKFEQHLEYYKRGLRKCLTIS